MHTYGSEWTYKDKKILHSLWARRREGESTVELADILEITPSALCDLWRGLGYDPSAELQRQRNLSNHMREVYQWRREGKPYSEICRLLGRDPTPVNRAKVMKALMGWCQRAKLVYPQRRPSIEESAAMLFAWRSAGVSFKECAIRLGEDTDDKSLNRLTNRLAWWCQKTGRTYPSQNVWCNSDELAELYRLRKENATWRACAEALGVEFSAKWRTRMTARLIRYAEREGLPWPLHPPAVERT